MDKSSITISVFITGKIEQTKDGWDVTTFLVVPADKKPEDILPDNIKSELGMWWKKTGPDEIIKAGEKIAYGTQDTTSIMKAIDSKGFATFTLAHGTPKD